MLKRPDSGNAVVTHNVEEEEDEGLREQLAAVIERIDARHGGQERARSVPTLGCRSIWRSGIGIRSRLIRER